VVLEGDGGGHGCDCGWVCVVVAWDKIGVVGDWVSSHTVPSWYKKYGNDDAYRLFGVKAHVQQPRPAWKVGSDRRFRSSRSVSMHDRGLGDEDFVEMAINSLSACGRPDTTPNQSLD
jgi:hypothetical protein